MQTKLLQLVSVSLLLGLAQTAFAEKICGQVVDDQPEIAANLDELRRFTIVDGIGAARFVVTDIDPDALRGAPLRAIREARKNGISVCVQGKMITNAEDKMLMVMSVDRDNRTPTLMEAPVAAVADEEKSAE